MYASQILLGICRDIVLNLPILTPSPSEHQTWGPNPHPPPTNGIWWWPLKLETRTVSKPALHVLLECLLVFKKFFRDPPYTH